MTRSTTLALVLALAACGDDTSNKTPDGALPDAPPAVPRAVVVSGNFMPGQPGVMSSLDLGTTTVAQRVAPNGAVAEDPMVRHFGDELFVVNRASGNNVTILNASTFALVEQLATGAGSNPQDVAVVGGKLYVPGFGTAGVVVVPRGGGAPTTIDLSALDPDGKPDCVSAFAVGTNVFVACELLDETFTPRGPGKIVVIDTATDTVKGAPLTLTNVNPFGVFERMPEDQGGDLVIPTVSFADGSGCIERVTTGATPTAPGCLVQNQALGGFAARTAFQDVGGMPVMWVVSSSFGANGPVGALRAFDLTTKMLVSGTVTPATQLIVDVVGCPDGSVVVSDQTMAANGLRVYNGTTEKTTAPLAIGLAPNSNHGLVCY
ncbi:MAG: hypothetical protein KF773_07425 [Deltaproteobacteria bacterium]|nr:hypothetical protein [Deltaproteobacteria bacterium]MCW5808905.1 hypothetical protein [Deltaproteobacteria bacterium]